MKFTVTKSDFIDVLSKVQGITNRKSSLAITETVLIKSTDKGIAISATDLETGFEGYYPATVDEGGMIAINARRLLEIARDFPNTEIQINEVENRWFEIGSDKVEYRITGMNPDDFPDIPKIEAVSFFEIESQILKEMIEATIMISAASDEKRAHILGINFESVDAEDELIIRMVSTDGKRLSKYDYPYLKQQVGLTPGENVLVPKKAAHEAAKFLTDEGMVAIGVKDNHLVLKRDNETIIMNLLEGEFPKYEGIITIREDYKVVELDRQLFLMMLKRMSILTTDSYKGVTFQLENDLLTITTANPDIGHSKEEMSISFQEAPIKITFNPRFFIDALNMIASSTVLMTLRDEEAPCLLQGENDINFLCAIMPMKV